MWQRIERDDIDKARESLGYRLAETLRRHQQEIKSLRAKHADELHIIEVKQAELGTLDALIERFAGDFQARSEAAAVQDPEPITKATADNHWQLAGAGTTQSSSRSVALPDKLAVRYAAPSFRPFRNVAA